MFMYKSMKRKALKMIMDITWRIDDLGSVVGTKIINNELEKICKSTIDLTVLSYEEEVDVEFLKRLKVNYLKIK